MKMFLSLAVVMALCGCAAIINHFDGKAQAWDGTVKYHAKVHPQCGKSTFCKVLNREIGPGDVMGDKLK